MIPTIEELLKQDKPFIAKDRNAEWVIYPRSHNQVPISEAIGDPYEYMYKCDIDYLKTHTVVDWFEDEQVVFFDGPVPKFLQLNDKSTCSCDMIDLMKSGCICGHLTRFEMFL